MLALLMQITFTFNEQILMKNYSKLLLRMNKFCFKEQNLKLQNARVTPPMNSLPNYAKNVLRMQKCFLSCKIATGGAGVALANFNEKKLEKH